jgi:Zn-dependent protease
MDWEKVITLFVVLIISLTVHEASHGLFAWLGGDRTAKDAGLVTINPIPHMRREPIGMILIPVVVLYLSKGAYCFGGASAPIDPYWAARYPKKAALMSAAGPLANVVLAAIAFGVLYFIGRPVPESTEMAIGQIAWVFVWLNMLLALFNLIPLPPFDGAGIVRGLLPSSSRIYAAYQKLPLYFIVSMIAASYLVGLVLFPMAREVRSWLQWPYWR